MKALKSICNVFGILIAIVLSLVLLVFLIVSPVFSGVTSLVRSETLHGIVRQIDFSELIVADPSDPSAAILGELMQTELIDEVMELYIDDVLSYLDGSTQSALTADTINSLVQTHMDELLPIMREYAGADPAIDDETLKQVIVSMFDGEALIEMLPSPADLGITEEVIFALSLVRSNVLLTGSIILFAVLSLLIFCLRWPRFKGFMWLAVVYIIGALFNLTSGAGVSVAIPTLVSGYEPGLSGVLSPVLAVLTRSFLINGAVLGVLAIVFIVIFALGRKALKKKKLAAAPAAPAASAAPVAEEVTPVVIPSYVTEGFSAAGSSVEPTVETVEPAVEAVEAVEVDAQPAEPVAEEPIEEPVEEI